MSFPTRTSTSFLEDLHDPSATEAWREFDRRYTPIITGFARHLGLGEADAADVAQETVVAFLSEYRSGGYSRDRGRLRSWLLAMARSRIALVRRRGVRHSASLEVGEAPEPCDDRTLEAIWETQRRRELLRQAMDQLRTTTRIDARTIRAFELLCIHRMAPEVVADELGMQVRDVYVSKFRVAQRLRTIVASLQTAYPA